MDVADADELAMSPELLRRRCEGALLAVGASRRQASVLARATVQAELHGRPALGLTHLLDYVDGFRSGRIVGGAEPVVSAPSDVVTMVDCAGGVAQHGFETALTRLTRAAFEHGIAVVGLSRSFTVGEAGFYVRELVEHQLMGLAFANSPALMAAMDSHGPLLGTNPMAFGVPVTGQDPLVIDQATSAMSWVAVRAAAQAGVPLASGAAIDSSGTPTTSADAALTGALLPFGGYKGGNVALLVELLSSLAGGTFSCEAAPFDQGSISPSVGLFVVAIATERFRPGFGELLRDQLRHWEDEHGATGVRRGRRSGDARELAVSRVLLARLP